MCACVCVQVVYVTATLPYVLLTAILFRGLALPGAMEGITYYLTPRFDQLLNPQVCPSVCPSVSLSVCLSVCLSD